MFSQLMAVALKLLVTPTTLWRKAVRVSWLTNKSIVAKLLNFELKVHISIKLKA